MELPFTILLLLSFSILAFSFLNQDKIHLVEDAMVTDITENANFAWAYNFGHKNIDDVNSYADFWSWARLGLLPITAPHSYWYSEGLQDAVPNMAGAPNYDTGALPEQWLMPGASKPVPIASDYLLYNRIIGGLRFRQKAEPLQENNCRLPPGDAAVFQAYVGKGCSKSIAWELPPDNYATEAFGSADSAREEWLLFDVDSSDELVRRMLDMEDGCTSATAQNRTCLCNWCSLEGLPWLSEETQRVEIAFVSYNPAYGMYTLSIVNFWFNRAGHIHKAVNVRSSWAGFAVRDRGTLVIFLISAVIWLMASMHVFRSEGWEMVHLIRRTMKPWYITLLNDYISLWNCIDWLSICIAMFIIGIYGILQFTILSTNQLLYGLVEAKEAAAGNTTLLDTEQYHADVSNFMSTFEDAANWEQLLRFWLAIYPLVLMLRLFKSFSAQPRLAIVTETFKHAASDMLHFFLVFSSVYFCLTVNAVLFFGQDDVNFSRLDWALFSCWRAMLGDWDWESMERIGRERAFLWFFLFLLLVVLILMNILVSILMEAYGSVKGEAANADSLFMQTKNMIRRARETRERKRVRLNDIEDALLADSDQDENLMRANTRQLVPRFIVTVDRCSDELLGAETISYGAVLIVQNVLPDSVLAKWNAARRVLAVKMGDAIVEVNGVKGETDLLRAELRKAQVLTIRLRRIPRDMEFLESVQEAEKTGGMSRKSTSMGRRRSSLASMSERTLGKSRTMKPPNNDTAFLMDLVPHIPESQAKRTLGNALDEDQRVNGEEFTAESVKTDLGRMLDRVSNSILCAGWLGYKFEEYDVADRNRGSALATSVGSIDSGPDMSPTGSKTSNNRPEALIAGIQQVRQVAEERTWELADDVAAVLGEEMQALERRQRDQQRSMAHTQDNLQSLRHMVYKLNETCDEVGRLCKHLSKETQHTFNDDREDQGDSVDDPAAVRAKLLAVRQGGNRNDDMNFHGKRK